MEEQVKQAIKQIKAIRHVKNLQTKLRHTNVFVSTVNKKLKGHS